METVLLRRPASKTVSFKRGLDPLDARTQSVLEMINKLPDEIYRIFFDDILTACESRLAALLKRKA